MGCLNKSSVYLAGPIDHAENYGSDWREAFTKEVDGMGLTILDPTNKPGGYLSETEQEQNIIKDLKSSGDYEGLKEFMKKIRRYDLRLLDNADFIIAYIDTSIHMCGTYDEIFTAEDQQKPIFYIVKGGKETLSSWMFAVIDNFDLVFDSLEDCVNYVKKVDDYGVELDSKWVLFKDLIKG